jgi:hypothetical protein
MGKLKKQWFLIVNVILAITSLVIYIMYIMGASGEESAANKKLETGRKALENLARSKPTEAWYAALDSNVKSLEVERDAILKPLKASDDLIHRYFDLDNRDSIVMTLSEGRYPEFKEMLQEKWNSLARRFSAEKSPFVCKAEVLTSLEPKWLRTAETPGRASEASEAMKRYWIVLETLEILENIGVFGLDKLSVSEVSEDPLYANNGKPFWGIRKIQLTVSLESKKVIELMKMIHESPLLFRLTGFEIKNEMIVPEGVASTADYVVFDGVERQKCTFDLDHYDLVQEGEELIMEAGVAKGSQIDNRRVGRR